MRSFLIILICFNLLTMPAYSVITDDFVEQTLDKSVGYPEVLYQPIVDDFAGHLEFNAKSVKKELIIDDFAESNTSKNLVEFKKIDLKEEIPQITGDKYITSKKKVVVDKSELQQVDVRIKQFLSSKQKLNEGEYIEFETVKAITIQNKVYPAGSVVKARIENVSMNKSKGVPADIVIGNFMIGDTNLLGEITKTGANRSLWIYSTIAVTTCVFGLGILLMPALFPIRGGHAKISPSETYTLHVLDDN